MKLTNPDSTINWSGYGLSEYLLLVHPNEEVHSKIAEEKRRFCRLYKDETSFNGKPHITIAKFLGKASLEKTVSHYLQQAGNQQTPFCVTLSNFSSFSPNTIFFNVLDHQPFEGLRKKLQPLKQLYKLHNFPPVRSVKFPHLSLIRRLSHPTYHRAIPEYRKRRFYESFIVNELILVKRDSQLQKCQPVEVFRFGSQNLPPTQLKLDL